MAAVLQKVVSVQSNDPGLVGLGNISKDHIHHACRGTDGVNAVQVFLTGRRPTLAFVSRLQTNLICRLLTNKHPVFVRVPSVLDDWNDVGAFFRHVEKVATRPVGELHCIDQPLLSHNTLMSMLLCSLC